LRKISLVISFFSKIIKYFFQNISSLTIFPQSLIEEPNLQKKMQTLNFFQIKPLPQLSLSPPALIYRAGKLSGRSGNFRHYFNTRITTDNAQRR